MINKLLPIFGIVAVFIIIGFGGEIGKQITKKDPQTDTNTETYYGMIEYTFQSTGVTHLVFQKADSDKSFCNELNEGYLLGLKTTCPDCVIKSKFCSTSLPSAYQDIFSDKPMVLPFLSAPNKRIVVLGIPVQQAISLCHEMAEAWRLVMNQDAKCITKNDSSASEIVDTAKTKTETAPVDRRNFVDWQKKALDFSLDESQGLEGNLKLFADAEQDVFYCAMIVAKSIESESSEIMSSKAEVLAEIASKYADMGQIDRATKIMNQALETANAINPEFWKASALAYIARKYSEAGQFTEALDTANAINDEFWKANSLAEIAGMYAKAGQTDKTAQLLTQALRTAYGIEGEYLAWTLAHIAGEHAKAGQKEKAEQLLSQAYETAKEMETLYWKAEALANIASNYAVAGLIDKSAELLTHAFEVTHRIIDGWSRDLAYVVIADEYTKLEMLTQALETANTISREYAKDPTLAQIAGKYAEAGQFTEALDTANAINDENEKARALANIANEYAEKGEINRAAKLLNQTLETVYSSNHELWKATMLAEIAGTYAKAGQTDKTAQLLTQALRTAYGIEDELSKARVLTMIGGKFFDASIQPNEQDKIILYQKGVFSISLPHGWVEIPSDVIGAREKEIARLSPNAPLQHYDYGFQLDSADNWLEYPYILVQIKNIGRVPESQIEKLEGYSVQESLDKYKSDLSPIMSDIQVGKMYYDESAKMIWLRGESNVVDVGPVSGLSGMILTEKGFIQVSGYSLKGDYSFFKPVFRAAAMSVTPSSELVYKPKFSDSLPPAVSSIDWGKVAGRAIAGALIGGLVAFFADFRRKKKE